jgi:hypothetical protein
MTIARAKSSIGGRTGKSVSGTTRTEGRRVEFVEEDGMENDQRDVRKFSVRLTMEGSRLMKSNEW